MPSATSPTILITGAAGNVARLLIPSLSGDYQLRLADIIEPDTDGAAADTLVGDLADPGFAQAAVDGVDAVVHLAGQPDPSQPWPEQVHPNILTVGTVLQAAATASVGRLVLASSLHVMGHYNAVGRLPVDPDWPAAPCCLYGATKAFAELAARYHAQQDAYSLVCLRLGWVTEAPVYSGALSEWLGVRDLRSLVRAALTAPVRLGTYFGVSHGGSQRWDITKTCIDLGYQPVENSDDHAHTVPPGAEPTLHGRPAIPPASRPTPPMPAR